jgi:hypothetical protein
MTESIKEQFEAKEETLRSLQAALWEIRAEVEDRIEHWYSENSEVAEELEHFDQLLRGVIFTHPNEPLHVENLEVVEGECAEDAV